MTTINEKQKIAIEASDNPIIVIAGAGTGKTYVLVERIIYLLKNFAYHPNSILAFTFTNKAANEIKNRIEKSIDMTSFNWIGTFHSICLKILRFDIDKVGKSSNFLVIDEDEKATLIKEIYDINGYNKEIISHKKIATYISLIKNSPLIVDSTLEINELLDEYDFSEEKKKMISGVYFSYKDLCSKKNFLDFDDLILETLTLLKSNESIRKKWQNYFSYILVDEFQDTSFQQFELIKLLTKDNKNIFIVGDPDQMIYSWRGAYTEVFEDFRRLFPNYEQIVLEQNYRSTKKILNISNRLISKNKERVKKNLFTNNNDGDNILYFHASSSEEEIKWVINKIKLLTSNGYKYNDILILYRSNYLSRFIEQGLISSAIPYIIYGGFKFFQRKEIKDIISYLKLSVIDDDVSLSRIYNVPKRKIGESSYSKLVKYATKKNISYFKALEELEQIGDISQSIKLRLNELYQTIKNIRDFKYINFVDLVDKILDETKYLEYLKEEDESYRFDNIKEFKNSINEFQLKNKNSTIINYLQEISLYTEKEEKRDISDHVSLMTIHNAKGLEFKVVFITSFNENDFPSAKAINDMNLSEERRLAYVAMTRAREKLLLTSSSGTTFSTGSLTTKTPSRFIKEIMNDENLEVNIQESNSHNKNLWKNDNAITSNNNFDDCLREENVDYFIGEKIKHDIFGIGTVVNMDDFLIDVAFPSPIGVKKLMKNHKKINKLSN